jgi:hypothetical protein
MRIAATAAHDIGEHAIPPFALDPGDGVFKGLGVFGSHS